MSKKTSHSKNASQRKQERLVVGGAVGAVIVSVATTLYITGALSGFSRGDAGGYSNITFTDAVITCKDQTRSKYKNELHGLTLDDHSSRFDEAENTYKIFFNAQMTSKRSATGEGDFFINCFVEGRRGGISDYVVYEDRDAATRAIRKSSGGIFGWPLN